MCFEDEDELFIMSQMNNNLQSTIINKQPLAARCIVHCAGSADFEPISIGYRIAIAIAIAS